MHRAGWVHRDFSVTNVLWVEKDGQGIGKLTDLEYAKRVDSETSHDVRTVRRYQISHAPYSQSIGNIAFYGRRSGDPTIPFYFEKLIHNPTFVSHELSPRP